jgi:hypothetical protein
MSCSQQRLVADLFNLCCFAARAHLLHTRQEISVDGCQQRVPFGLAPLGRPIRGFLAAIPQREIDANRPWARITTAWEESNYFALIAENLMHEISGVRRAELFQQIGSM